MFVAHKLGSTTSTTVASPPHRFVQFDFTAIENGEFPSKLVVALFTFLYVDLLDTTATLFAMAKFAGMLGMYTCINPPPIPAHPPVHPTHPR